MSKFILRAKKVRKEYNRYKSKYADMKNTQKTQSI